MAAQYVNSNNTTTYGVNGIVGDRFTSVAGWEHGTVGFAGNVYSRLASENGIQPVDPTITGSREPFKVGRFMLKILKNVPFFDPKVMEAWRYIIEDTSLEFSGIQSYQLETFQKTHGVVRQNSTYVGIYKENNGDFTIKVPETAGQLVRKAIDYWHFGMSDSKTGVAHFYGKDIRDLQPNKSMTIMYILLGPTCRPEDIEYAAIYHDCVCTTPKHDHVNAGALGEAGQGVEHDLTFSGIFDRSPEVDRLAAVIVDREGLYEERAQNSLLPAYVYDTWLNSGNSPAATQKEGMALVDRISNSIAIDTASSGVSNDGGMATANAGLKTAYDALKTNQDAFYTDKSTVGDIVRTNTVEGKTGANAGYTAPSSSGSGTTPTPDAGGTQ